MHDIGKFIRRSGNTDKYTTHHFASYKFINENLKGKGIFDDEEIQFISSLVRYHHDEKGKEITELEEGKANIYLKMLKESDSDSASERKNYTGENEGSIEDEPLTNILSAVNSSFFDEIKVEDIKVQYPNELYPFAFSQDYSGRGKTRDMAKVQYENFMKDFQKLVDKKPSKDEFIISLNFLLKRYTSYITSSGKEYIRDISLYHHTSTTAAFYICRYFDNLVYKDKKEKKYGLVFGRIFDIQNYIFGNINKNMEKPLKRILNRSSIISLINTIIPYEIIRELNLYPFNITFCGGGSFLIVIPKTFEVKACEILNRIQKEVSDLFENKIYFEYVIESLIAKEDKEYSFEKYFRYAFSRINQKKYSRNLEYLKFDDKNTYYKCRNCDINTTQKDLCRICSIENVWMDVELSDFIAGYDNLSLKNIQSIESLKYDKGCSLCFSFDSAKDNPLTADIKTIGSTKITKSDDFCTLCKEKDFCTIKDGGLISINCLSNISSNDTIIATAKIDVDDLSYMLYEVYPFEKNGEKYPFSISRLSFMSTMIDSFFANYVKFYIEKEFKDKVMLLYSGGDDLLLTGQWDSVINAVIGIEMEFQRFISKDDKRNITLSSAILLHKSNKPYNTVTEKLSEYMEKAKAAKNCVVVMGTAVRYKTLESMVKYSEYIKSYVEKGYISRKFVYDMLKLLESSKKGAIASAKKAAHFNYILERNVMSKTFFENDKEKDLKTKEKIKNLFSSLVNTKSDDASAYKIVFDMALRKTKNRGDIDE